MAGNKNYNLGKQTKLTTEEEEEDREISRLLELKHPSIAANHINWVLDRFPTSETNSDRVSSLLNLLVEMVWSNIDGSGSKNWMIAHNEASKVITKDGHISLTEFMELLREYGLAVKIHAV